MTLFDRYRRQPGIGQPPAVPREQQIATAEQARGFDPVPPEIGAGVLSAFDARPIGARDFLVTAEAEVLNIEGGFGGFVFNFQTPQGSVLVLRRFLAQVSPARFVGFDGFQAPLLFGSVRRNGAPIVGLDRIGVVPFFETWHEVWALFGPTDTLGIAADSGGATLWSINDDRVWVTIAGTLLVSTGRPTPLEVGHTPPKVRIEREPRS